MLTMRAGDHDEIVCIHKDHLGPPRWAYRAGVLTLIIALLAIGAGLQLLWVKANRFDPLGAPGGGPYTVQMVQNTVPGVTGPAIQVPASGEASIILRVSGTKCNNSDETITVRGQRYWRPIVPNAPVFYETPAPMRRKRPPGCASRTSPDPYTNLIPDEVIDKMQRYARGGVTTQAWVLVGDETPYDSDGDAGVTRSWETSNFTVIVK